MLRIQLISNRLGTLTIDRDDPIGIQDVVINLKRSEKKQGIVYTVLLSLQFITDARNFIQTGFETDGGIDCVMGANVYERADNNQEWELRFDGSVNCESYDLAEDTVEVNVNQNAFQLLVETLSDIDVDVEAMLSKTGIGLPDASVKTIQLHSKAILKQDYISPTNGVDDFDYEQAEAVVFDFPPGTGTVIADSVTYGELASDGEIEGVTRKEIDESFAQSNSFIEMGAMPGGVFGDAATISDYEAFLAQPDQHLIRFPKFTSHEAGILDINLKLKLQFKIHSDNTGADIDICGEGALGPTEAHAWLEIRDKDGVTKQLTHISEWSIPGCGDNDRESEIKTVDYVQNNITVAIDDSVYLFTTFRVFGNAYERGLILSGAVHHTMWLKTFKETFFDFKLKTTVAATTSRAILLHEAFERCIQFITGQANCFRSTLLGRTDLGYDADGKYSLIAYTNGKNVRNQLQLNTTNPFPIITSLNELYNFVNVLTPIGIGFERQANGQMIAVLESIEYFYDKSVTLVDLGPVEGVHKKVNKDRYYSQIEIGYTTKMDVDEINAIDEFNTLRRYNIPVSNSKNKLIVTTPLIASGYIIETQRRYNFSTKDSKYDDGKFVISLVRDGDNFKSRKTEGYTIVSNVFDSATVYNIDLTPAQSLQNWFPVLATCLVYAIVDKIITFAYGEYNYTLVTKKTGATASISENGQFDISLVNALWDNLDYELSSPLSIAQLKLIEVNPKGLIRFSDVHGNPMAGFVSTEGIRYQSEEKTDFTLIKSL